MKTLKEYLDEAKERLNQKYDCQKWLDYFENIREKENSVNSAEIVSDTNESE